MRYSFDEKKDSIIQYLKTNNFALASREMQKKHLATGKKFDKTTIARWVEEFPATVEELRVQLKAERMIPRHQIREK
jgi:hypothetical protein